MREKRERGGRLARRAWLAWLLAVHGVAAILVLRECSRRSAVAPEFSDYYAQRRAFLARRAAHMPEGAVLVFGDSRVEGLQLAQVAGAAPVLNLGIGGDTARRVRERIDDYDLKKAREVVLVTCINDLSFRSSERAAELVRELVEQVEKRCALVLCTAPLVRPDCGRFDNAEIQRLNASVRAIARASKLPLVDLEAATSENGELRRELALPDGVHLNAEGCARVREALRR